MNVSPFAGLLMMHGFRVQQEEIMASIHLFLRMNLRNLAVLEAAGLGSGLNTTLILHHA